MIDQVRRLFGHARGVAGGKHTTALLSDGNPRGTRVGDEKFVLALVAVGVSARVLEDLKLMDSENGNAPEIL
jgi:hypothetical protein